MRQLLEVANFVRRVRLQMRFGELSRAPLRLLRLELQGRAAECNWMVRPPDVWDASFRRIDRERNVSQQALRDAITMRDLLFVALPDVESAVLRAFRPSAAREPPELVITGCISREACSEFRVSSLAMRAKLYGFHFSLNDEVLQALQTQEHSAPDVLSRINFHNVTL